VRVLVSCSFSEENGFAEIFGGEIVEEPPDLEDGPDVLAGVAVHGDESFDAELEIFGFEEDAGVDGAGRHGGPAVFGGVTGHFNERDHVLEWSGKGGDVLAEVGELVLEGDAPVEGVGRFGFGGEFFADGAGEGEGAEGVEGGGEVAEAFTEIEGGGEGGEGVAVDGFGAGAADVGFDADGKNEFVRGVDV